MLPMNKIFNDVAEFAAEQEKTANWEGLEYGEREDKIAVFAHELSQRYDELVSVKLVKSLITTYLDSIIKDETNEI